MVSHSTSLGFRWLLYSSRDALANVPFIPVSTEMLCMIVSLTWVNLLFTLSVSSLGHGY